MKHLEASTLTSANIAQKASGDNLNSIITLLQVVSKKANKTYYFFFPLITEASEPFEEAFELQLTVICLMFRSPEGEAVR